jgi:hypothetical protein
VTEVKDEDFYKGIARNAVQLESVLSNRKRKASEMEEGDVLRERLWNYYRCKRMVFYEMFV